MLRRAKAAHEGGVEMILAPNTDLVGMFEVGDGTVIDGRHLEGRTRLCVRPCHLLSKEG